MFKTCYHDKKITRFGVSIEPDLQQKFDKTIKKKVIQIEVKQ
jgi:metal-responsive CopG/Arc/MetJ family transcriptional regulator